MLGLGLAMIFMETFFVATYRAHRFVAQLSVWLAVEIQEFIVPDDAMLIDAIHAHAKMEGDHAATRLTMLATRVA